MANSETTDGDADQELLLPDLPDPAIKVRSGFQIILKDGTRLLLACAARRKQLVQPWPAEGCFLNSTQQVLHAQHNPASLFGLPDSWLAAKINQDK
jgi:hypothetical protein